jgi:hypothetical protein
MSRLGNGWRGGRSWAGGTDETHLALIEIALLGLLTTIVGAIVLGDAGRATATFGVLVTLGAGAVDVARLARRR